MKKVGIMIFAVALVVGLVVANMFSFGKSSSKFFNFSFNFKGVKGSGNVATDVRGLSGFKAVDVGGVFKVEITAQKEFGVEVEADDNLLPFIQTEVRDGVLHIDTERKLAPANHILVRISAPDIDNLDISGVADVTLTGVRNSSLTLDSSGASKIKVSGETTKFTVDVSGATKIDAEELKTVDANIDASGASTVTVNVSGELRGDASGASKILYTGTPANIEKNSRGASRVSPK